MFAVSNLGKSVFALRPTFEAALEAVNAAERDWNKDSGENSIIVGLKEESAMIMNDEGNFVRTTKWVVKINSYNTYYGIIEFP